VYARRQGGKDLTFDFGAGLVDDNLLIVDRETGSVWSQLAGQAITGPMQGTPLEAVPSIQTTWRLWRTLHPQTRVMTVEGEEGRPYLYRNRVPGVAPPDERATEHDTSVLGLGLVVGSEAWYFPLRSLDAAPRPLELEIAGQRVRLHYHPDDVTAWAEDAEGALLMGVMAYESGWKDFHPETRVYSVE